ncbi:ATP-binding cassette domain-containing protein [Gracilibacillus salitolerans]|uniref:ATP-binding cassette domain-containing protein n=1 Tax=Gracilibacillus salitolerans TaxID=2663022 RepID=A0A5Q2TG45_9BACI|nr:ABC transporter ATP-binding protein [Gracilibacillus salitolerans]QGH33101.1 ATP-binding cassette domain-containing protein [Gracilibacillus salitolerans]
MIDVKDINHTFLLGKKQNETALTVLKNISFSVDKGDILAITGKSGSGKSTLLNIIGGFMKPTSGSVFIKERNVTNLNEGEYADFRLDNIGFIFQNFQLIPSMTAYENVELPLVLKGLSEKERVELTEQTLEKVGLSNYHHHYPSELSGGQQQRVSIARTLVIEPPIILADEPTGSLDSETEQEILDLITGLNQDLGITFLMITHDEEVARIASKQIHIHDGEIVKEEVSA